MGGYANKLTQGRASYPREELEAMREAVARENKFALYKQYSEEAAAHYLDVDISTLKRWRREGKVPFVNLGERQIRYFGFMIADKMLGLFDGKIQQ